MDQPTLPSSIHDGHNVADETGFHEAAQDMAMASSTNNNYQDQLPNSGVDPCLQSAADAPELSPHLSETAGQAGPDGDTAISKRMPVMEPLDAVMEGNYFCFSAFSFFNLERNGKILQA